MLTYATILLALASPGDDVAPATGGDEARLRAFLAEEIRRGMLPDLVKFSQKGGQNWGHMAEKRVVIPAVEGKVLGRRVVVTPRREETVKYKDGEWVRYTASFDDPERNLKVEVLDFRPDGTAAARFTVRLQARLKVDGDVAIYRLDVGAQGPFSTTADLVLLADCRATVSRAGDSADVELKVEPRELNAPEVVLTRLGPFGGEDARKLGAMLRGAFAGDFRSKRDALLDEAKRAIRQATIKSRVKALLVDILLD